MKTIEGIESFKERFEGLDINNLTEADLANVSGGSRPLTEKEIETLRKWKQEALAAPDLSENQRNWIINSSWGYFAALCIKASFCRSWKRGLEEMGVY